MVNDRNLAAVPGLLKQEGSPEILATVDLKGGS
jgi:hypothetical protein